nr:tRNA pseudouridine(38-40) synthase TruA [Propionibacterium sp.]
MTGDRLRLDLAYDGAGFHGWAAQGRTDLRTVQGELEGWLERLLRRPVAVTCAGRTDAGVHARGQVVHLDVLPGEDAEALAGLLGRRLPRALPADLVVRRVAVAPPGFDARFAAVWRRYVYRLTDAPAPDPLTRGHVLGVRGGLDVPAMDAAGAALVGLHDFAAFCKRREGATTIRTLLDCTTRRTADLWGGDLVEVEVRADAFCHSMVRSLVGALVDVGRGRRPVSWPASLLDRPGRAGAVPVLPPHGLVLEEVGYPPDGVLAARVAEARALREPPVLPPTKEQP